MPLPQPRWSSDEDDFEDEATTTAEARRRWDERVRRAEAERKRKEEQIKSNEAKRLRGERAENPRLTGMTQGWEHNMLLCIQYIHTHIYMPTIEIYI